MAAREVERYNKAVRRNISSLLTKCENYSSLGGIELALYISFPQNGGFVSYESANLNWRQDIEAKELSGVLESTREVLFQNSQRLAIRLEARLEGIQDVLNALLQGRVPITTGYFGAGPAVALAPAPAPSTAPTLNFNTALAPAPEPLVPGMPVVTALARVFTVGDVWMEWEEGIAGQPAVRVLEETWGSRWRPGNGVKVQFCRRKVIWDELLARTASGKSKEEAVVELELLRAGRSLNRLVDELKKRRQRGQGQGQIRVQVGTPVPDDPGPGQGPGPTRGQGHRGRWTRLGRRRTAPRRR
ncbi:uncharacterized protein VDAG_02393 [Verticillium dahliae VdLs.17]|uniref:Transcription activator GCR1-like domain-containing protein n=1 Tax=Verticillium dahliae (strain VdLs.17 / ATCC MYA-4575 / FGSC 10137) TaxID=498257 RepID=G2WXR1_VERDV|nr:uncharacterized protein VDAG_02393 [Verticillium dahliae VdLs.17]EGY20869.1 hypothetical protein VDAG_02393 [Verticillium dahliae VdLs.17]